MTDLMSYLHNAYNKHLEESKEKLAGNDDPVGHFTDFCKKKLKENPPTSVFMAIGLAFRLANGDEVQVVESPPEEELPPESISITKPKSMPGQRGITDTRSVPVFGGGK